MKRLTEPWTIDLYKFVVEHPGIGVDAALEQLSELGKLTGGGGDRTTAYRAVRRLRRLMQPAD